MSDDFNELLRIHRARELAKETIEKFTGPKGKRLSRTYLAAKFQKRSDVPETAHIVRMTDNVIRNLAKLGFHEPVSLRMIPGRWWKVNIDAAEVGEVNEYGCAFVSRILSTGQLEEMGFEVTDGPFRDWESKDVSQTILKLHLGKYWDARIFKEPNGGYDDGYTSEDLLVALDMGQSIQVFSGPYDKMNDAHYALDLRWEYPGWDL